MIDFALNEDVFIYREIDEAIQELDLLFCTENTELIGHPEYGSNWHQFMWQLSPTIDVLKSYIVDLISKNTMYIQKFPYNIDVTTMYEDNGQMVYVVGINIKYNDEDVVRTYILD